LRAFHNRMPLHQTQAGAEMLADCPPAFALPARQCLELAQHIYQEFAETAARHELDAFMTNIAHLAYAHRTLHRRAQRFGTPEQKAAMAALPKHLAANNFENLAGI